MSTHKFVHPERRPERSRGKVEGIPGLPTLGYPQEWNLLTRQLNMTEGWTPDKYKGVIVEIVHWGRFKNGTEGIHPHDLFPDEREVVDRVNLRIAELKKAGIGVRYVDSSLKVNFREASQIFVGGGSVGDCVDERVSAHLAAGNKASIDYNLSIRFDMPIERWARKRQLNKEGVLPP